jgi:glycosyltransferase involved in cell wall biosynthesis
LLRVTDATICVSRDDANIALSNRIGRPESNFVIPNAINVTRFSKVVKQKRKNRNKNKYVVGTIGRLDVPKGHTYFLKAAAHVLSRLSKVEFQIIGDGHLRSELEKECHQLGIESNVKFLGTRYDIPEILSTWNVFVLPSLWEGMPLVILEAMAARCPVIATAVNGVNEILQDQKDALIVPIKNDYALADGILRLLMDSKLAASLARTAYKKVITNSSINNMVDKIEDVYRFVLQGRD